jgi:hypothetical protein
MPAKPGFKKESPKLNLLIFERKILRKIFAPTKEAYNTCE